MPEKSLKNISDNQRNIKKSLKRKTLVQKKNVKSDNIEGELDLKNEIREHFNSSTSESNDKMFCDSLNECSNNVLNEIGYSSFSETLKQKVNESILNFSYLLKLSFLSSIKLAVSIFGIVAFSVPSIEKIYKKGKNISTNMFNKINSISSKIKNNFLSNIIKLGGTSPVEILKSIRDIILRHKVLVSISTVSLVLFSIKFCQVINLKGGINKLDNQILFSEILKNKLSFFPFNSMVGQVIIEYTGMFIDNSRDIVNKIIEPINLVCKNNRDVLLGRYQFLGMPNKEAEKQNKEVEKQKIKTVNCNFGFFGRRHSGEFTHEQIRNVLIILEHPDYKPTELDSYANKPLNKCPSPEEMCSEIKRYFPEMKNSRFWNFYVHDLFKNRLGLYSRKQFVKMWARFLLVLSFKEILTSRGLKSTAGLVWFLYTLNAFWEELGWLLPRNKDGSLQNTSPTYWGARRRQNRIEVQKMVKKLKKLIKKKKKEEKKS